MTRTLPWGSKGGSTVVTKTKRTATTSSTLPKKPRIQTNSDVGEQGGSSSRQKQLVTSELLPSSSPPPEAPEEKYMIEGLDNDDRFRMVEDELLSIAQTFTTHLHAAEYKRQQKMVKSRNADTIDSISRPAVGKMPDHTRRRVEAIARARTQQGGLEGLLGKKKQDGGISDDSDDGVGLPYIGTTLHGLMDSPRKKAALISKAIPKTATTRASAGFNKPATKDKSKEISATGSSKPKVVTRRGSIKEDTASETSDDDDLDAPIPAPKLTLAEKKIVTTTKPVVKLESDAPIIAPKLFSSDRRSTKTTKTTLQLESDTKVLPSPKSSSPIVPPPDKKLKKEAVSYSFDDVPEFMKQTGSRPSRVRARQFKAKEELPEKKLDEIPNFT